MFPGTSSDPSNWNPSPTASLLEHPTHDSAGQCLAFHSAYLLPSQLQGDHVLHEALWLICLIIVIGNAGKPLLSIFQSLTLSPECDILLQVIVLLDYHNILGSQLPDNGHILPRPPDQSAYFKKVC